MRLRFPLEAKIDEAPIPAAPDHTKQVKKRYLTNIKKYSYNFILILKCIIFVFQDNFIKVIVSRDGGSLLIVLLDGCKVLDISA
jgi:hypothetical protein